MASGRCLFITTATANNVVDPETGRSENLMRLYPGRTFRGCFTNEAMARAVVDFVWQQDDLKPKGKPEARAYVMAWQDDPYSVDLAEQFEDKFRERKDLGPLRTVLDRIAYSVGTFTEPNPPEREVMERILPELASHPSDRSLLVLPAVTQPARRIAPGVRGGQPVDRQAAGRGHWGRCVVQHAVPRRRRGLAGSGVVDPTGVLRPPEPGRLDAG